MADVTTILIDTSEQESAYLERPKLSEVLNLSADNTENKLYPHKSDLVTLSNLITDYAENSLYPKRLELSEILGLYSNIIVENLYLERSDLPQALTLIFDNIINDLIINKSNTPETLALTDNLGYKIGKIYTNEEAIEYDYIPIYKRQIDALANKLKRGDLYANERGQYKVVIIANNTNISLDLSSPFSLARRFF